MVVIPHENDDESTENNLLETIFNHPVGKARSEVWKVFGFYKLRGRQGPATRENLDMTKAVCWLCRNEYTNKGLYLCTICTYFYS